MVLLPYKGNKDHSEVPLLEGTSYAAIAATSLLLSREVHALSHRPYGGLQAVPS